MSAMTVYESNTQDYHHSIAGTRLLQIGTCP
jgi:hypothetical protein